MRTKCEYRTSSKENYLRFLKKKNLTEEDITYKKYCDILEISNWMFIEYALKTGKQVYLPFGFGPIVVTKKRLKMYKIYTDKVTKEEKKIINLRIDWFKTKKLGKRVYHTNEHSDGFNCKWMWFSNLSRLHMSGLYVFKPCRYASRAIARYVKNTKENYIENYLEWERIK